MNRRLPAFSGRPDLNVGNRSAIGRCSFVTADEQSACVESLWRALQHLRYGARLDEKQ